MAEEMKRRIDPALWAEVQGVLWDIKTAIGDLTAALEGAMQSIEMCDGEDPDSGAPCALAWHQGYHRTAGGVEWLDAQ